MTKNKIKTCPPVFRWLLYSVVSILCVWFFAADAAELPSRVHDCQDYEADWSASERSTWTKVCYGRQAILSNVDLGSTLNDLTAEERDAARLSATFINTILRQSPYREHFQNSGFRIQGAEISEPLLLTDLHVGGPLLLTNCHFSGLVDL